jgi:hypothetical protein
MGWGPALVLAASVVLMVQGLTVPGLAVAVCGILFGFIVRRRMNADEVLTA